MSKVNTGIDRWTENHESVAKEVGEKALGLKIMHIEMSRLQSMLYEVLMIVSLFLSPMAGTIDVVGTIYPEYSKEFLVSSAAVSFISGILIAIVKFSSFDEESTAHKSAAAQYTSLESNVRRQLALHRDRRPPPDRYIMWLSSKYEELFLSSPLIPHNIQRNYSKVARENGIAVPEQIEGIININTNYMLKSGQEITNGACSEDGGIDLSSSTARASIGMIEVVTDQTDGVPSVPKNIASNGASNGASSGASKEKIDGVGKTRKQESSIENVNADILNVKRNGVGNCFAELAQCSDGAMEYEMSRFFGINDK